MLSCFIFLGFNKLPNQYCLNTDSELPTVVQSSTSSMVPINWIERKFGTYREWETARHIEIDLFFKTQIKRFCAIRNKKKRIGSKSFALAIERYESGPASHSAPKYPTSKLKMFVKLRKLNRLECQELDRVG
jgi:hypothetical protein